MKSQLTDGKFYDIDFFKKAQDLILLHFHFFKIKIWIRFNNHNAKSDIFYVKYSQLNRTISVP